MFRIAICDDEPSIVEQLERMILEYPKHMCISTEKYYSGEALCGAIQNGKKFDLIILDIELDEINGVYVGNWVRKEIETASPDIIFISGAEGYERELFDIRPINFLSKPIDKDKLFENIDIALKNAQNTINFLEFKSNKSYIRVPLMEIRYLESDNKTVIIHTLTGTYTCYGKMKDMAKNITEDEFIMIHRSYLVNWRYIRVLKYDHLILDNDEQLPISQSSRSLVRSKYIELFGG